MTVIVFLIDNSASMNQRTYAGTTLLDVARGAVDQFLKMRQNYRNDRYLLVTFEEPPQNLKTSYIHNNHQQSIEALRNELKNITANGVTTMGIALRRTFDFLNLGRMKDQLDNYGLGVLPNVLENVVILAISDGQKLTTEHGIVTEALNTLPDGDASYPGIEMTKEPFRWDQRLYGLILRFPAIEDPNFQQPQFIPHAENTPINTICELTGGRTYSLANHKSLSQCLESLHQKCQLGVVISFEKMDQTNDTTKKLNQGWEKVKRMIYLKQSRNTGWWPIPEPYWPDTNAYCLPPRSANPQIRFECKNCPAAIVENFPFDRYEVEPCPLTQYILERRDSNLSWPCYILNSGLGGELLPFGYLRPSSSMQSVCLIIHVYNYPVLLPLIEELVHVLNRRPSEVWRSRFVEYLRTMPPYYGKYLNQAFERLGLRSIIPEASLSMNPFSYHVTVQLNKSKKAAQQTVDLLMSQAMSRPLMDSFMWVPRVIGTTCIPPPRDIAGRSLLCSSSVNKHSRRGGGTSDVHTVIQPLKPLRLAATSSEMQTPFSNPFHVKRLALRTILPKLRKHLLCRITNQRYEDAGDESRFAVPIAEMGNFQRELERRTPPLRELFERPARLHTFGNPFKRSGGAQQALHIDETDEVGASVPGVGGQRRRLLEGGTNSSGEGQTPPKRMRGPLQSSVTLASLRSPRNSPAPHRSRSKSDEDNYINLLNYDSAPSPSSSSEISDFDDELSPVNGYGFDSDGGTTPNITNGTNGIVSNATCAFDHSAVSEFKSMVNGTGEDTTSAAAAARALLRRRQNSYGINGGVSSGIDGVNSSQEKLQHDVMFKENVAVYENIRQIIRSPFIDGANVYKQLTLLSGDLEQRHAILMALIAEARNFRVYKLEVLLSKYRVSILFKAAERSSMLERKEVSAAAAAASELNSSSDGDDKCGLRNAHCEMLRAFHADRKRSFLAEKDRALELLASKPLLVFTEKKLQLELQRKRLLRNSSIARGLT